MSPILLATDLSPWCDRAKERAILLARRQGSVLRVVTVMRDEADVDGARRAVTDIEEMLAAEAADLATEISVRHGEAWEEIGAEVRATGTGLVVMGRHRSDALKDFFLSPTAAMVDSGPPILQAVNASSGAWRDIVVCTDFSERGRRALDQAVELAADATLHLLHVFDVPFSGFITNQVDSQAVMAAHRAALETIARDIGPAVELVLAQGAVVPTLFSECRRLSADLLVIGTAGSGSGGFGGTARALTMDPPCDLLVVPPSG